ncbi:MAG: glutamine-hydrolyzing carbamoyl-phosphate synthase small subunit [Bdellovibrionaceae bacterium]|nr:glutamine-hydrolyzing carbamoyl-phosphate synthase small subunit [Bdellovibrionales bacterium]MCB9086103.1 glutamine-hydrolyzing carbamoyl-phosphate synthase small subunit [Pseudobdellovibrionaceae bacterium]
MERQGYLVLESGAVFSGTWLGGKPQAGEVVFNTSHSGYEEMATDPSYFSQILVTTAPMQGNYGESDEVWESGNLSIRGFVCLEIQNSDRDMSWKEKLIEKGVPVMEEVDTRRLVIQLREQGTVWGAMVSADSEAEARAQAHPLISQAKEGDPDWVFQMTCKEAYDLQGEVPGGPRLAVLDFGCKTNILRELRQRCSQLRIFPSRTSGQEIRDWSPDGIMLSNGPGNPSDVQIAVETVRELLGWRFIFGICMGHQILSLALGANTYKLKFGHRGSNHPIRDDLLKTIYVTSQNHGYAVDGETLPEGVRVTHVNLNDNTVSGIQCEAKKCMSVQFHPESHPGPHDAVALFDYFVKQLV